MRVEIGKADEVPGHQYGGPMTVRWGIVGTGKMAAAFAGDLALVRGAELAAVGSRRPESAAGFGAEHGAAVRSYRGLIEDPEVDVVYIATPHPQHRAIALAALAAGKPVVVEKAFTATLAGAESVAAAARSTGVFCMEAMWTRFQPAVVEARRLIDDGAIGEVRAVQADLGAYRRFDAADRLFAPELGGGATLDLGVYVVSIAQHFLGTPDSVTAAGSVYPNGADAGCSLLLGYPDGRGASLYYSLQTESPGRAVIMGTEGSIELAPRFHHPTELILRRNGSAPETFSRPALGRGYTHEILAVDEYLAHGLTESPIMPLADTLAVQGVLEQVLTSLGVTAHEDDSVEV